MGVDKRRYRDGRNEPPIGDGSAATLCGVSKKQHGRAGSVAGDS